MEVDEGAACQPNSATVQGRGTGMNLDVFEKQRRDKSVPQPPENGQTSPVPPERRKYRANAKPATNTPNVPNLSILNAIEIRTSSEQIQQSQNIPNVSLLNGSLPDVLSVASTTTAASLTSSEATLDAPSANDNTSNGSHSVDSARTTTTTRTAAAITTPNVPLITLLIENSTDEIVTTSSASDSRTKKSTTTLPDESAISYNNLPAISALNLNTVSGENGLVPHAGSVDTNSLDDGDEENYEDDHVEDDDEDADVSLRNLSNSEHQTSNNDSSLTTVTGTSGENSFELTNDSSSASNDDSNIPNLSELQKDL